MTGDDGARAERLAHYWDALVAGERPAMSDGDADLVATIRTLHMLDTSPGPDPAFADRLWRELVEQTAPVAAVRSTETRAGRAALATDADERKDHASDRSWFASRRRWLAPAAAIVVVLALLGAAIGASDIAQAQIRRLGCLVPAFGIQACEAPGLVAAQPVSVTQDDLTASIVYLVSIGKQTNLRMEIRGLVADTSSGQSPQSRPQLTPQEITDLEATRVELQTDRGQTLVSNPSTASARPGAPLGAPRFAVLRDTSAIDDSPTTHLRTTAEWTFPALDPSVRAVDLVVVGPVRVWRLHVPLIPLQQAGLPTTSGSAPAVTRQGISVWVDGVSEQADGLLVQIAARVDPTEGRGLFVGDVDPESGVFARALADADGHQYLDTNKRCCPPTDRTEGDTYYRDLTFPRVPPGSRLQTLDVPWVGFREDIQPVSMSIPLAGHAVGERIPLATSVTLGHETMTILAATLEEHGTDAQGRPQPALLLDFDFGDWPGGRRVIGPYMMSVNGQVLDPRGPPTVVEASGKPTSRYKTLLLTLPPAVGPQLIVTFTGPVGVMVRGPWVLPVPSAAATSAGE